MRPEVEALAADERGMLLGLLVSGVGSDAAAHLDGPGSAGCAAALASLPDEARAAECAALASELAAPFPKGIERVHPGWIRRALEGEPGHVVRAVVRGAPEPVRRVADELLSARGEAAASPIAEGPLVDGLRRAVFAALAPMPEVVAPTTAGRLCAASVAELLDEIDRRGAATLGLALAGAPDAVVARAAAGAGDAVARALLAASRAPATPEERARARVLVASVGAGPGVRAVRAVGLAALAGALAAEGPAVLAAVAQRLPPSLGDALLASGAA